MRQVLPFGHWSAGPLGLQTRACPCMSHVAVEVHMTEAAVSFAPAVTQHTSTAMPAVAQSAASSHGMLSAMQAPMPPSSPAPASPSALVHENIALPVDVSRQQT